MKITFIEKFLQALNLTKSIKTTTPVSSSNISEQLEVIGEINSSTPSNIVPNQSEAMKEIISSAPPINVPDQPEETNEINSSIPSINVSGQLEVMQAVYQPQKHDWMEFEVTKKNRMAVYVISSDSSDETRNLALLTKEAYNSLLILKDYYPELYEEYLYMLKIINEMKCPPPVEIRHIMRNIKDRMDAALSFKNKSYIKYIR